MTSLLLIATTNTNAAATTPSGWTLVSTVADATDIKSSLYTRTAIAGVSGSTVRVAVSTISKTSLSLVAYSDAASITTATSAAHTTAASTIHVAPSANVAVAGSTVLRYMVG